MPSLDLTIAIPVKNEARNLPGCVATIRGLAKKVVVIDSGSTDRTKEIATQFGADVVDFVWDGKFPKKRNWYLRNHTPATKWVLFLDADEYLTEEFKNELEGTLDKGEEVAGYWLRYTRYFMGSKLKGGYPLKKLALFKVGGEYEYIDEDNWSQLDMEVHEHPVLNGAIGQIKAEIDHQDFRGISHYVLKHNDYASWEAARFIKASADPGISSKWTWKQRLKYRLMNSILIGPLYFLGSFFLMGGFRDGKRGFVFAILKMSYFTQVYCKIQEIKKGAASVNA